MPNYANLRSRPKIEAIKPSKQDTVFYRHDGDALTGLRLAVGKRAKTWVMTKRINGKVRTVTLGRWPEVANGDAAMDVARDKIAELEAGTRVEAAKEMLKEGDLTIENIGKRVGFETASGFAKAFRDRTGMTPREFRSSIKKEKGRVVLLPGV